MSRRPPARRTAASTTRSSTCRSSTSATASRTSVRRSTSQTARNSNRSDTTDSTGAVSFAALTPNPTSGSQAYYDLTVAAGAGYQTLAADVPSGSPTPPATGIAHPAQPEPDLLHLDPRLQGRHDQRESPRLRRRGLHGRRDAEGALLVHGRDHDRERAGGPELEGDHHARRPAGDSRRHLHPARLHHVGHVRASGSVSRARLRLSGQHERDVHAGLPGLPDGIARRQRAAARDERTLHTRAADRRSRTTSPSPPRPDSAGNATLTNIPSGSGYTIAAGPRFGQSGTINGSPSRRGRRRARRSPSPTRRLATLNVAVTAAGQSVGSGVPVTLGGGACSIASQTDSTDGSGVATFTNVPVGSGFPSGTGYTASVAFAGISGSVNVSLDCLRHELSFARAADGNDQRHRHVGRAAGRQPACSGRGHDHRRPLRRHLHRLDQLERRRVRARRADGGPREPLHGQGEQERQQPRHRHGRGDRPAGRHRELVRRPDADEDVRDHDPAERSPIAASTGIDISITGGPNGNAGSNPAYSFSLTTDSSGVLPAVTVPQGSSGSTYTIKANLTTCGASGSNRSGSQIGTEPTPARRTAVTVNMTTNTCPFSPLP